MSNTAEKELLNFRESAALLGVSIRTFHALRAEAWMPAPLALGERLLRWRRAELIEALAERAPRQVARAKPQQLASARGVTPTAPADGAPTRIRPVSSTSAA
jgi:predicted DNA-binding transcriptional regulator AlpA